MNDKMSIRSPTDPFVESLEGTTSLRLCINKLGITEQEVRQEYDKFAREYDKEMKQILWNAPNYAAKEVVTWLKDRKDACILDVASGTGLMGEMLQSSGFKNIDALEPSQEMLNESRKGGAYRKFYCEFMGPNRLDIPNDTYDVVVTAGSFAPGHLKEDCYEEIIRITKPGGYFILVMAERRLYEGPSYGSNIEPRMMVLKDRGLWKRLKREVVPNYHNNYNGVISVLQMEGDKNLKLL